MSGRIHGDWIRAYLEYTRLSESPTAFHFWTAISVIAGALRRRVWIEQRVFKWIPNFYIIFVAPASIAAKSTSMNIGMRLLERVDGINFGPQSTTWQALTQALDQALEFVEIETSAGGKPKPIPMSCITCPISELGTFLHPKDTDMVDTLTSLWDGLLPVWRKDTKGSGRDVIQNPWINIIGCTTPSWIRQHFTEDLMGGGLASRTLFVYAERKRQLIPYPAEVIDETVFEGETLALAHDLAVIATIKGEYTLTAEAKAWGKEWYRKHWTTRPAHMASERYEGYIGRKQTHLHKTAIVLAASESNDRIITEHHLKRANKAVSALETNMRRVFEKVGESAVHKHLGAMLSFLDAYGELDQNRLWRNCLPLMSGQEFTAALAGGLTAGLLRRHMQPGGAVISRSERTK